MWLDSFCGSHLRTRAVLHCLDFVSWESPVCGSLLLLLVHLQDDDDDDDDDLRRKPVNDEDDAEDEDAAQTNEEDETVAQYYSDEDDYDHTYVKTSKSHELNMWGGQCLLLRDASSDFTSSAKGG